MNEELQFIYEVMYADMKRRDCSQEEIDAAFEKLVSKIKEDFHD